MEWYQILLIILLVVLAITLVTPYIRTGGFVPMSTGTSKTRYYDSDPLRLDEVLHKDLDVEKYDNVEMFKDGNVFLKSYKTWYFKINKVPENSHIVKNGVIRYNIPDKHIIKMTFEPGVWYTRSDYGDEVIATDSTDEGVRHYVNDRNIGYVNGMQRFHNKWKTYKEVFPQTKMSKESHWGFNKNKRQKKLTDFTNLVNVFSADTEITNRDDAEKYQNKCKEAYDTFHSNYKPKTLNDGYYKILEFKDIADKILKKRDKKK